MSIPLLRKLLMKEAVKDTAGSSGIMSINKNIAAKVEQQLQKYVNDAMQQGVDLDTLSPEQLKMIVQMNKPKPPRVISADSPEGRGITEALLGKRGEVVDFPQKRSFKQEVDDMIKDGTITKGPRGMKKSKKVQDREMFQDANKRLKTDVDKIIADIKAMDPMDSMKEANSVIGRKGAYKNLTPEESKKILKDTEDHIFERDIPEEDFAGGGVAGLLGERPGYRSAGFISGRTKSSKSKSKSSTNQGPAGGASAGGNYGGNVNPNQTYGGGGGGNNNTGGGGGGPPGTNTGGGTTTTPTLNRGFLSDVRKINQQRYLNLLKTMKPDDFSTDSILDDTTGLSDEDLNFLSRYGAGKVFKDLSKTNIENFMEITDGVAPKVEDLEMDVDRPRKYDFAELGKTPLDNLALGIDPRKKVLSGIFNKGIKPFFKKGEVGIEYETPDLSKILKERVVRPETDFFKFKGGVDLGKTIEDVYNTGNLKVKPQIGIEGSKGGVNYGITYDKDGNAKFNLFKKFADGGPARQNFAMGRRAFLKMLAGTGAGIAGLKSGLFATGGKEVTKKAVTETVKSAGNYPPPYFFKLVEKIKFMGDDVTQKAATQDRQVVKKYKDYEMSEDLGTGEIVIKKRNEGSFYDQDGIISDEYIVYKPGQADELTKGKKPPPEYDEYTVRPDAEGKLRDSEDGLDSIDEILEEVGDPDSLTLKKASGGIARMLGE